MVPDPIKHPLEYCVEKWLFDTNRRAWGWVKLLQAETNSKVVKQLRSIMPEIVREAIVEAYERNGRVKRGKSGA